jgi:arylsulfatase A-like enzyme
MDRVRIPSLILLLAMCTLVSCGRAPTAPPPDLVLVVIDTCRRDALGSYGADPTVTPHLDAFAREHVRFERAIAPSPWTLPSVATMLTGRMPGIHGAYGQGKNLTVLRPEIATGAEVLRDRGWATGAVVNAPFLKPPLGLSRGFEMYDYVPGTPQSQRRAGPSVDIALERLEANRDRPDLLLLHVFDPHLPYDPPADLAARAREGYEGAWEPPLRLLKDMRTPGWKPDPPEMEYLRRVYDAEVTGVDRELGRFFRELEERGLAANTCVVVTADHGEEFHDHGGWEHGHTMYEELVHVPLLVKLPAGREVRRHVVEAQVSLLDLLPTLFDVAGEEPPADLPGTSFLEMITGEAEPVSRPAISERVHLGGRQFSLRDGEFAWLWWDDEDRGELYRWTDDPREREEISARYPEVAERMREELLDRIEAMESAAAELSPREELGPSGPLVEQLKSLGYAGG